MVVTLNISHYNAGELTEITSKKIEGYLGIAQKAGKIAAGDVLVFAAIAKKKAKLVVVAEDISPKVVEELEILISKEKLNIPIVILGTKLELGLLVGKSQRGLLAVIDDGFAKAIVKAINSNKTY